MLGSRSQRFACSGRGIATGLVCIGLLGLAKFTALADCVFVWRRLGEYQAIVAGKRDRASGAYSVNRFAKETVIRYPMYDNWSDTYHVIFDHGVA